MGSAQRNQRIREPIRGAAVAALWSVAVLCAACTVVEPDTDVGTPRDVVPVDSQAGPGAFRVLTYNVHLFFDTDCDSGVCTPGAFERKVSQGEFLARAAEIAEAIEFTGADVACLQEIENADALLALKAELSSEYTTAVIGETGAPASIDVAVVAKVPVIDVQRHRDEVLPLPDGGTTQFTREFLEVHFSLASGGGAPDGAERLILFCAHFRSKFDDDPDRRLAEAQGARRIMDEVAAAYPAAILVLAGDLNDVPDSEPLDALLADGVWHRLAEELGAGDKTWGTGSQAKPLDHLIVPTDRLIRYVDGSVVVYRPGGKGLGGSDHGGLGANFDPSGEILTDR